MIAPLKRARAAVWGSGMGLPKTSISRRAVPDSVGEVTDPKVGYGSFQTNRKASTPPSISPLSPIRLTFRIGAVLELLTVVSSWKTASPTRR